MKQTKPARESTREKERSRFAAAITDTKKKRKKKEDEARSCQLLFSRASNLSVVLRTKLILSPRSRSVFVIFRTGVISGVSFQTEEEKQDSSEERIDRQLIN